MGSSGISDLFTFFAKFSLSNTLLETTGVIPSSPFLVLDNFLEVNFQNVATGSKRC